MEMEPRSGGKTLKRSLNYCATLPIVVSVNFLKLGKLQGLPNLPWGHGLLLHHLLAGKVERGALQRATLPAQRSESCLHPLLWWFSSQTAEDQKLSPAARFSTHTYWKANHISHFIRNKLLFPLHFYFPSFLPVLWLVNSSLHINLSRNFLFSLSIMSQKPFCYGLDPVYISGISHFLRLAALGSRYTPITHT